MVSNHASGRKHAKHRYILAVNLPDTFRCPKRQIATKKYKIICLSSMSYLKQKNSNTKYNVRTVFLRFAPRLRATVYTPNAKMAASNILLFKLKLAQLASLEIRYSFEFCIGERD